MSFEPFQTRYRLYPKIGMTPQRDTNVLVNSIAGTPLQNVQRSFTSKCTHARSFIFGTGYKSASQQYLKASPDRTSSKSTLRLGAVAGPIFCIILVVDCIFFRFLEWFIPRSQLDFVDDELTHGGTVFDRSVI